MIERFTLRALPDLPSTVQPPATGDSPPSAEFSISVAPFRRIVLEPETDDALLIILLSPGPFLRTFTYLSISTYGSEERRPFIAAH